MRYLNKQEIALLVMVAEQRLRGRMNSLSYIIKQVLDKDNIQKEDEISVIVSFLEYLEKQGVLNFKNVRLNESHLFYNDLFFIRFFDVLKKDKGRASKMLELFGLEGLSDLANYRKDSLEEILKLLKNFNRKIRVVIDYSALPIKTDRLEKEEEIRGDLLENIVFKTEIDKDKLDKFINSYLAEFKNNTLSNPDEIEISYDEDGEKYESYGDTYYPYQTQKIIFLASLKENIRQEGYRNLFFVGKLADKSGVRKFETLGVMRKEGLIKGLVYHESYKNFTFSVNSQPFEKEYSENLGEIKDLMKKIELGHEKLFFKEGSNNNDNKSTYFKATKVLKINGKEVIINKTGRETEQTKLLQTIFEDPTITWYSDAIYENWDENPLSYKGKNTIDNARRKINQKAIDQANLVDEFLLGNNQQVKINPEYL